MTNLSRFILIIISIFSFLDAKEIKLGMTGDFSGSINYLSDNFKIGIETYLSTINKNSQNKYKLITYDDQYNPILAGNNVRKLIDEDVVAFIGNIGTPTGNVTIPILNENKIISFGAYSGGDLLRNKATNEYIFNYRPSYSQEAYFLVSNLLLKGIKPEEIAFFTQNDTYGDSGYYGAIKALNDFGYYDVNKLQHGRYTRGTANIENGLSKILDSSTKLKAIVMVSVDAPTIKFIKYAKEDFPDMKFFLLSPINTSAIKKELKTYVKDIYITQVVPLLSSDLKIVTEYKHNLNEIFPNEQPNLISFEGYIIAKLFIESIKNINKNDILKNDIFEALHKFEELDIGFDFKISFNKDTHQYSQKIWFIKIDENDNEIEANWNDIFEK